MRRTSQPGLSLIEACVTLAVASIVVATAAPSVRRTVDSIRLNGAATQLASDLQFARSLAIGRDERVRFTLRSAAGGSCYVVHTGNAADCRCGDDGTALCTPNVRVFKSAWFPSAERVAVRGNVVSMLFDPVFGTVSPTGTLSVIGPPGEVRHTVNLMGRVRSCSTAAGLGGYRPC